MQTTDTIIAFNYHNQASELMTPQELRRIKRQAGEKDMQAIVRRDFTASRMSTTKWKHVDDVLSSIDARCRVKFVHVAEPHNLEGFFSHVTGDWFESIFGPVTSASIEWLKIDPIERVHRGNLRDPLLLDHSQEIQQGLREGNVPFEVEGTKFLVTGYAR